MWKAPLYKGLYLCGRYLYIRVYIYVEGTFIYGSIFTWKVPIYTGLYLCGKYLYIRGYIYEEGTFI